MLQYVEVNPDGLAQACVIWLHGLGADGYDFVDIVPQLRLPADLQVRFVFPHAPERNVDWSGGARMRAWFNVNVEFSVEDEAGIRNAPSLIEPLLAAEIARGIPSQKIIIAGFSQGGAVALQYGLRYKQTLGGILVLSSWLPLANSLTAERHPANQATPILLQHGTHDHVIPLQWATAACDTLKELKYNVILNTYPMGHTICAAEIAVVGRWLEQVIKS